MARDRSPDAAREPLPDAARERLTDLVRERLTDVVRERLTDVARLSTGDGSAFAETARMLRDAGVDPHELGARHEGMLASGGEGGDPGGRRGRRARPYVTPHSARRSAGAHYTPKELARDVAARALAPLLPGGARPEEVLALRVCDPSMGAGAFLLAACEVLAERLIDAGTPRRVALRSVAARCLFGVDKDPVAVALARIALWIATASEEDPRTFLKGALLAGDALVGPPGGEPPWPRGIEPFDWGAAFPEVLGGRGGFDAVVGNPPWISYAGRAAQPLDGELFDFYKRTSPAFFGYRNLQGLFVFRAATLLRPGGRLGLVLPTSMSDLAGYEPSRRAHDALCETDPTLPDFGDRFRAVFQPCMGLISTRRAVPARVEKAGPWPLERRDLDAPSAALLARLDALPKVPPELFGERGFQTMGADVERLRPGDEPLAPGEVGLRIGSDVAPFARGAPSFRCDPGAFGARFRGEEEWRAVRVLVRQTARWPMACVSDGLPFRNSVLASFEAEGLPPELIVAYLNAWPVRWFHYVRHRDARQGMPQLKIGHLRALPAPGPDPAKRRALAELGASLSRRNDGARPEEERALAELASDLLGLTSEECAIIHEWAAHRGE